MNGFVKIVEVGPRDGLQNEPHPVRLDDKVALIDALSKTGLSHIEAASFVSPSKVPQMADSEAVMDRISRAPGVGYSALVPNLKGYRQALAAHADEVAVFTSASETFSQRNINCSIGESLERFKPVLEAAKSGGVPVRAYISCVIACPFEGSVAPQSVAELAGKLLQLGCYEVSLGDTIGAGTPETIEAMLDVILAETPSGKLAGHYHDTGGRSLENVSVSLAKGLRVFDASAAGLGGCPFAPGAPGNLSTSALISKLHALGYQTGVNETRLAEAAQIATKLKIEAVNV